MSLRDFRKTRAIDDSLVRRYVSVGDKMCLSYTSMCSQIGWVKITYETRQTQCNGILSSQSLALTQFVLEALIEHIWRLKLKTKRNQKCTFAKAVNGLCKKKLINAQSRMKLAEMWANRHLFHHLSPSVDQQTLAEMARTNLSLLGELEHAFFQSRTTT